MLIARRKELGLTQESLARRLEIRQQVVTFIEQGERRIDVAEFLQIAEALEFDPVKALRELAAHHKPLLKKR